MEIQIASVKDVTPGAMMSVEKKGKAVLIANVDGTYYAIGDVCTHMGCKLSEGTLTGDTVQCACHGSVFKVKTGEVEKGPADKPEPSYSLRVDGDKILADLQKNSQLMYLNWWTGFQGVRSVIKKVYYPAKTVDGHMILIDRLWTRSVSKLEAHIDEWL